MRGDGGASMLSGMLERRRSLADVAASATIAAWSAYLMALANVGIGIVLMTAAVVGAVGTEALRRESAALRKVFGVMAMLVTGTCAIRDSGTALENVFMGCLTGAVFWLPFVLAVVLCLGRPIAHAKRSGDERIVGLSAAGAAAASLVAALLVHAALLPPAFLLFLLVAIGCGLQTAFTTTQGSALRA